MTKHYNRKVLCSKKIESFNYSKDDNLLYNLSFINERDEKDKNYECEKCNKKFANKSNLNRHEKDYCKVIDNLNPINQNKCIELNDSNLINAWYSNMKSTQSLQAATLISVSMVLSSVNLSSDSRFDDKNNEVGLDEMNKSLLVKMEQILKLPLSEYLLIKIKQVKSQNLELPTRLLWWQMRCIKPKFILVTRMFH
jgi:hypothetical protein